ncbi:MAG: hypothetical protein JJ975_06035 [Bacteroidia bacterium]|nr:hypothetical protein [Bacteroidia bacterium]
MEEQLTFFFTPTEQRDKLHSKLENEFPEGTVGQWSAFTGVEALSIAIPASLVLIQRLLKFYVDWRKSLGETHVHIDEKSIELSGFTKKEMKELLESKTVKSFVKKLNESNSKK